VTTASAVSAGTAVAVGIGAGVGTGGGGAGRCPEHERTLNHPISSATTATPIATVRRRVSLFAKDLYDDAFFPAAVELRVKNLLPRTQIERSFRYRQNGLVMKQRPL
jgi:hypothetical protein